MLTRVQISNINAIDFCDIDFQKGKYKYLENMIYQDKLVNPIAFYGSNGSGKSSFFEAILHVLRLMILEPQKISPFSPNRFNIEKEFKQFRRNTNTPITEELMSKILDSIKSFVKFFFSFSSLSNSSFTNSLISESFNISLAASISARTVLYFS